TQSAFDYPNDAFEHHHCGARRIQEAPRAVSNANKSTLVLYNFSHRSSTHLLPGLRFEGPWWQLGMIAIIFDLLNCKSQKVSHWFYPLMSTCFRSIDFKGLTKSNR